MRNLILIIIGSLFIGCANLDVAQKAYKNGDYNKTIAIYKAWAKRGFPQAQLKLAQIASNGTIKTSPEFIIKNLLSAYNKGYKKAANLLFYNYYKLGNIQEAKIWLNRLIFDEMNQKTFEAYLNFIQFHIKNPSSQINYIKNLEEYAKTFKNPKALYALGKFYEESIFINLEKSKYYYNLAWQKEYIPAGIKLALLYLYKLNKPKKGLKLLKKIAAKDNGTSAYNIALFLLKRMDKELQKLNTPCISFNFQTPKEFFIKKIKAEMFQKKFLEKNVAPWLNYAYKRGFISGKIKLISLDLKMRNFNKKTNLSHLNLKEAIDYLEQSKLFKAKMVLARIYESYPNLHQLMRAKMIYEQYVNINKTDAYWHLYQFYKRFYPQNKQKDIYLNYLVNHNFTPAIIEKAYFSILNNQNIDNSLKTLKFFAEQNNILALTYLASIDALQNKKEENKKLLQKLCHLTSPINPSLDIKIAKYYIKEKDILKTATIFQYYANKNPQAAYKLSRIYKVLGEYKKNIYWLKNAKKEGLRQAELTYARLILSGKIEEPATKAIALIKQYAIHNDPVSITLLGDIYKQGIIVPFNPKKAEEYYTKAMNLGYNKAYLKLIDFYNMLNINGQYTKKILLLYNKLLEKTHSDDIKISLAQFLFDTHQYKKAYNIIIKNRLYRYDKGKYLAYLITGDDKYLKLNKNHLSNNPQLLLLYAKKIEKTDRKKALYYAFLAAFYDSQGAASFIFRNIRFFSKKTVYQIYNKAKKTYKKQQKYLIFNYL